MKYPYEKSTLLELIITILKFIYILLWLFILKHTSFFYYIHPIIWVFLIGLVSIIIVHIFIFHD